MQYEEVIKIKQGLLMLTGAVVQLIYTSTTLDLDQNFKREIGLLAYHRTKQIELLNQLHEVIHLRVSELSDNEPFPPAPSDYKETKVMEFSVGELLTELLDLIDHGSSPKAEYLLSVERLREKWVPTLLNKETEPTTDDPPVVINAAVHVENVENVELKELTKSVINPILHWSKNKPKKHTKQKNIRDKDIYQIQIGSKTYEGFI
ncbi:hypothetical protein PMSD_21225 [Paenibacillus macquariensis subsp. defensor]|nr:hypothetical protein PMSD_21225 [Paenibacillus macquariensis subsp. defensor]